MTPPRRIIYRGAVYTIDAMTREDMAWQELGATAQQLADLATNDSISAAGKREAGRDIWQDLRQQVTEAGVFW